MVMTKALVNQISYIVLDVYIMLLHDLKQNCERKPTR